MHGISRTRRAENAELAHSGAFIVVGHEIVDRRRGEIAQRRHVAVLCLIRHLYIAVQPVGRVEVGVDTGVADVRRTVLGDRCVTCEGRVE